MLTKSDTSGHEKTLTLAQQNAIDRLIAGGNDSEAAEAAGVTRQTVNTWRNHEPSFIAELNARRQDLHGAHIERLRAMVPKALDCMEWFFEYGDPKEKMAAAVHVLRAASLYGVAAPGGHTDPEIVKAAQVNEKLMAMLGNSF